MSKKLSSKQIFASQVSGQFASQVSDQMGQKEQIRQIDCPIQSADTNQISHTTKTSPKIQTAKTSKTTTTRTATTSQTENVKLLSNQVFTGERALYQSQNLSLDNCVFQDGESPLKESHDLRVHSTTFKWKYPLWYTKNVEIQDSLWTIEARAGVWYSQNIRIKNSLVGAPKNFRKSQNIILENVTIPYAQETLWWCQDVTLQNVDAAGDYFAMGGSRFHVKHLKLDGNYSFDGCRDIVIEDSQLLSKDAFWNCENVTVNNCLISGEYIGWNSKNLTFNDCTISSLQGLCYIQGLTLNNCRLIDTSLAFEYCTEIDATISTPIDSVINPVSGKITAPQIGELIQNDPAIDTSQIEIFTHNADAV